jgi:hypothetical protein
MIRLSLKPSKLCVSDPRKVTWSGNDRRQSQTSMKSSPNLVNQRFRTFTSSTNKEEHPSMTKPQGQPATMTINAVTPSKYTTSTPQITYPLLVPQITYPMPNNANLQNKLETNPPPLQICEPPQQTNNFPTHSTILTITGGSNTDFDNKRQWRDYYRQVNHIAVEGHVTKTKWFHIPITFSFQDINLASFPHIDVTTHVMVLLIFP